MKVVLNPLVRIRRKIRVASRVWTYISILSLIFYAVSYLARSETKWLAVLMIATSLLYGILYTFFEIRESMETDIQNKKAKKKQEKEAKKIFKTIMKIAKIGMFLLVLTTATGLVDDPSERYKTLFQSLSIWWMCITLFVDFFNYLVKRAVKKTIARVKENKQRKGNTLGESQASDEYILAEFEENTQQ